ncbi:MAG: nuclease [Comamonadaceae bacterium]|nr:nuclease [Comamonadaceae bacterium]
MKRAWLLLGWLMATTAWAGSEPYAARVTRVPDGDTIWVKPLAGGPYRKLRLLGIDAPEICQDGGEAARDSLARRLLERVVQVDERGDDVYGRGLARIELEGEDLNAWLVQRGLAWASGGGRKGYTRLQAQARQAQRGVFARPGAEPPRDFRRRHGPCPMPPRPGG